MVVHINRSCLSQCSMFAILCWPLGSVMYQTSPEDPVQSVAKLCHKHSSESVMLGEYSLSGGKVRVHWHERSTHCSCIHTRGFRVYIPLYNVAV